LRFACNDATVVASQLKERFGFPADDVVLLLDADATLERIRSEMASLARKTSKDDRVIFFYAGHGHTVRGNRREAGFLVPVNGTGDDTSSLLPWDELVSAGNLIQAKHVLYIMDACYSGLISMRKLAPGSARIARDMLSRYSRQYLTAGKADEVVADSGGPRHGHSIFTGHLLDAMGGAVASSDGLVTANAVIAYVYDRVSKDPNSGQTPHYGWLDGDGDLFFTDPMIDADPTKPKDDQNQLVEVPADLTAPAETPEGMTLMDQVKERLSEQRHRIQLSDLIARELRATQRMLGEENFPTQGGEASHEEFAARLDSYEKSMANVLRIGVLLGRWAEDYHQSEIRQLVHALAGQIETRGGLVIYLALRSYPMLLTLYAAGIAAIEGENYRALNTFFSTKVVDHRRGGAKPVLVTTVEAILDVDRTDAFKRLPDFQQKYVPRSEYLFTRIQPIVEDVLFLGSRYESLFDRFEVLYALSYLDLDIDSHGWAPPGRFAWKHSSRAGDSSPFVEILLEATQQRDEWPPIRAGMFGGSVERFLMLAEAYKAKLDKLNWW